jgi:citrate lyase beta subunit
MHGMSLGPADLAASRGMKTTRVGGGHPVYGVLADAAGRGDAARRRAAGPVALHGGEDGRRLRGQPASAPFYGPFGDFSRTSAACEAQFRNAFLMGCVGAWSLAPSQIAIAKRVFSPAVQRWQVREAHPRGHAGWQPVRRRSTARCRTTPPGSRRRCWWISRAWWPSRDPALATVYGF